MHGDHAQPGVQALDGILLDACARIDSMALDHPVRVGIDGVDCAGKTTFAGQLASLLVARGREVIRASIDGFHNRRSIRYADGDSPEAYYRNSFDYDALESELLCPLGHDGNLRYRRFVFDYRSDSVVIDNPRMARRDAVLVFDGVFLHRPRIRSLWDFTVFVRVSFETVLRRAAERDSAIFGGAEATRERYLRKYIPGQKIYLEEAKPYLAADLVIDNDDVSA